MQLPTLAALIALLSPLGCGGHDTLAGPNAGVSARVGAAKIARGEAKEVLPAFDPAGFVRRVDNPLFPLAPGTLYTFRSRTDAGEERIEVHVTHDTQSIMGITATVVRDQVFLDGSLTEDTFDYYAQDGAGNVWYLGEDTKEYENGVVVSTEGTWLAGKDGALPGIIMLARPQVRDEYPQERAPGVAEDRARVVSVTEQVTVPYGTFQGCVQTLDWSPLQPGAREYKYYARGIGVVLEVSRRGRERVELISVTRR